jgi:hypothetical protein
MAERHDRANTSRRLPHKHAIQQTFFLYVYEPGGNRVEVANVGARLILAPGWKPIVWTEERKKARPGGSRRLNRFTPMARCRLGDEVLKRLFLGQFRLRCA